MAGTDQRTSDKPHDVQNHYAPGKPGVIYAGTQNGPYRSTNQGDSWEKLDYPKTGAPPWTFMFRPGDSNAMYLGAAPGEIYRSTNGGDSCSSSPKPWAPQRLPWPS